MAKKSITLEECKNLIEKNGGWLDLRGTQITSLPENLTVGGWLDLSGTQITSLPENLTVGGWLDLRGTQITSLPENLTVGGGLYLSGTQIPREAAKAVKRPHNGDIRPGSHIYADNRLFCYSGIHQTAGEYTIYRGKIKGQYLVTDGTYWAHCSKPREGIADILFKKAADRGADQYRGIDLDKAFTVEELQTMYRVITGACRAGTEAFVNSIRDLKERYTVREAIQLTRGAYNSDAFARFFDTKT